MEMLKFLMAMLMFLNLNSPADLGSLPDPPSLTMSFVGDCTISTNLGESGYGSFNWYAKNYEPTYFLEKVADIFESDDFTIVNCETALSDRALTPRYKGEGRAFWFIGPAANARIFSSSGVEIAALANNHTNDYGAEGLRDTVEALEAEGLTVAQNGVPIYFEKNGVKIGFLACGIWYAGAERTYYSALAEMCENSDIQIVFPHGGTEGTHEPEEWRKTAFRNLIDHGADLVVACHAHRLQPMERYNGGTIVYGLGNFCFGGNSAPQNRSAIYQFTVTWNYDGSYTFDDLIIPCYVFTGSTNNWQPCPVDEDDPVYQKILDFMEGKISSPA